jgi:hypothetical protein
MIRRLVLLILVASSFGAYDVLAHANPPADATIYLPLVAKNFDPSWAWSNPITATLTPAPYHAPLATIDHLGRLHILWDTLTPPQFIYHTYLTAQGWTSPTAVAQTLGTSEVMYPPLVDTAGILHLAWRNNLGTSVTNPYRIMYARFDGTQWSSEEEVFRSAFTLQALLHTDQLDQIRIGALVSTAFISFSSNTYDFVRSVQGWSSYGPLPDPSTATWIWPDMQGAIRFYGDFGSNAIAFTLWKDGHVLTNAQTINGGTVSARNTQLDGQNNLHVFWTGQVPVPGGFATGLYHQCLSGQLVWDQPRTLSGLDNVASLSAKASDNSSRVVLGFKKTSTGEVELYLFQGCGSLASSIAPVKPNFDVLAMALSHTPSKLCVLSRKAFTSDMFETVCSDINR